MNFRIPGLTFDDHALEKAYRLDHDYRMRHFNRLGCLLSIGVWVLMSGSAYFVAPRHFHDVCVVSYGVVVPVLAITIALTYMRKLAPLFPWASGVANTVTSLAFMYASFTMYYHQALLASGMVLMSLYAFFIFRLRFAVAAVFTTAYLAAYQALLAGRGLPAADMFINSVMIWGSQAAFIMSAYLMEKTSRSLFLNSRLLTDRNREIEEDLVIARMIMDRLLPAETTPVDGCTVRWLYRPMDMVGGDFLEVRGGRETLRLFIADVSGHGLASSYLALVTAMSLGKIDPGLPPCRVMEKLNDMVCGSTVKSNYVTAFMATVDTKALTLTFTSAGHPPALLFRKSTGETRDLRTMGKVLGWVPSLKYREETIPLRRGDRLVLYTDGVTECMDGHGAFFGEERLRGLMASSAGMPAEGFVDSVIVELRQFCGGAEFNDDVTLVVADLE